MAYTPATLCLVTEGPLQGAGQQWQYTTADAKTTVDDANYFSSTVKSEDAFHRGLKVGDIIFVNDTATPMVTIHRVLTCTSGASTVSAGLNIT